MSEQKDIFRDDPKRHAEAWCAAAESALTDVQFSPDERQRRYDYYMGEARKLDPTIN